MAKEKHTSLHRWFEEVEYEGLAKFRDEMIDNLQ